MKSKLFCYIILVFSAYCFADTNHLFRLYGGTDGIGAGYHLFFGSFYSDANALIKYDVKKTFSKDSVDAVNNIQLSPVIEFGGAITIKKAYQLAPFFGVAVPFRSFRKDSSFGLNYSTQFRIGTDMFWLQEDVPFFSIGLFMAFDNIAFYGIGARLGISIIKK